MILHWEFGRWRRLNHNCKVCASFINIHWYKGGKISFAYGFLVATPLAFALTTLGVLHNHTPRCRFEINRKRHLRAPAPGNHEWMKYWSLLVKTYILFIRSSSAFPRGFLFFQINRHRHQVPVPVRHLGICSSRLLPPLKLNWSKPV